jgi:DNA-binding response OmpR family regulator
MRIQTIPSDSVDVLIVEDDSLLRTALRLFLEQAGYRCAEAADGHQGLAMAKDQPPRCVLLDLVMPGLDGFAVARRLRADLRTFGAHIHCVTGLHSEAVREQARQAGCEQFLTKPVDGRTVLEVVGREIVRENEIPATVVSGLSKSQAESLLDWLENQRCTGLAVTAEDDGFVIRCICPPGFRLVQEKDGSVRLLRQKPGVD